MSVVSVKPAVGPTQTPSYPRRFVVLLVFVLGALTALGPLASDLYLPAFPEIANQLGSTEARIQLTMTSMMLGLALGQAILGPLSDRYGRRKPLLISGAIFTVVSLACALAPTADILLILRFVQGLAGAAGMVIARAVIRDFFEGDDIARFISKMMLVTMLAPLLGPILGAQLLELGSWRFIFIFLTVASAITMIFLYFTLPESLPKEARRDFNLAEFGRTVGQLLRDGAFMAPVMAVGFSFAMMFTYISGFSFVSQNSYGATPQTFGLIFAITTIALVIGNQVNILLIRFIRSSTRLAIGCAINTISVIALFALQPLGLDTLWTITGVLAVLMFGVGVLFPNAGSMAMTSQPPPIAGTASAIMGCIQMAMGGSLAALASMNHASEVTFTSMTTVMLGLGLVAVVAVAFTVRIYRAREQALAA
ncbi:multidrug effflux MFS transporter [Natronoglycomyces albus]|uniref:Multidrug effflux MFS transporter n=1 Tax=Natronoglycomyces albus TaxID=2811108 RepID=A0A895XJM1_9ACTN|nr:multidrug effflux MFS transporter [Natronoglycomyces albus]QSB04012.1 multidrug effflux MFS transporter [Natronoglycomyces albus]